VKKLALICLTLVVALGALGVGYALWWDDLFMDVLVTTGDIGAVWTIEYDGDTEIEGKDVSSCTAYFVGDELWVDIVNAYPCIDYYVGFDIDGTGSVPIHFANPIITGNVPPGTISWYDNTAGPFYPPFTGLAPINWGAIQLHDDDIYWGLMVIHLDNTAAEGASYNFRVQIPYFQYNEDWDPNVLDD